MKKLIFILAMMVLGIATNSFKDYTHSLSEGGTSLISYYHPKFDGRKTASGEIFRNDKLTAAHRTLPFGTKVKLINPANGKSVVVTINDRGPFHASRLLDVSKAAFASLADPGVGKIAIEYEVL